MNYNSDLTCILTGRRCKHTPCDDCGIAQNFWKDTDKEKGEKK